MGCPMASLTAALTDLFSQGFEALDLPPSAGRVTVSNRPDLAQFQCNGALAVAKAARRPPREIATEVVAQVHALSPEGLFASLSLAGPGFINISLSDRALAERAGTLIGDPRSGVQPAAQALTVIVDYGGPNIAKPMHVGHLRASIIGESIKRITRFAGHTAIGDVHMGDWGLPIGMLVSEIEALQPDLPYFDSTLTGPYPADSPVTLADLERLYPQAAAACKADPARLEGARQATAALQAGRPGYRALWRHFMDVSIAAMKRDFGSLGVSFELWKGEADVNDLIDPMVEGFRAAGVLESSDGALVIHVAEDGDKAEIPPLIVKKSDGAVMYGTTDLGTIVDRVQSIDPDISLYVVDQRQHLHFEQVFRAARRAGIAGKGAFEHIGFGTMNGKDGKPFKTRAGGVMRLSDLLAMAEEQARVKLDEAQLAEDYPDEERQAIARKVGVAAVKFADLSNHRTSNYVFDLDRFTSFEGKTGPYLQYAAVRVQSLLRRAETENAGPGAVIPPTDPTERALILALLAWPDALALAFDKRAPNEICEHAYALAQAFSSFYAACHILSEKDGTVRAGRLRLVELTLNQLVLALDLLGIEVPDRM